MMMVVMMMIIILVMMVMKKYHHTKQVLEHIVLDKTAKIGRLCATVEQISHCG